MIVDLFLDIPYLTHSHLIRLGYIFKASCSNRYINVKKNKVVHLINSHPACIADDIILSITITEVLNNLSCYL